MDSRNNDGKGKKNAVPHIKISGAKNDDGRSKFSLRSKEKEPPQSSSNLTVTNVRPSKRDKERNDLKPPETKSKSKDKGANDSKKQSTKHEATTVTPNDVKAANGNGVTNPSSGKSGKIPMRRCASIDVGELGRKKKGKRKKQKQRVDKETLLAIHAATSKENVAQPKQRSGSLGHRPNSLKLANSNNSNAANSVNANNIFPTPVPQKRHSNLISQQPEATPISSGANTASTDVTPNDTAAILPPRTKVKYQKQKKPYDEHVDISDVEDNNYSQFPTGSGYTKHGRKYSFPSSPYHRIAPPKIHKTWLRRIGFVIYMCFAFMVFCPIAALLLVLFPLCIFMKCFLNVCCTCCTVDTQGCCVCGQRVSVSERFWIQNELQSPQVVQSLIIVEFGLSVAQIVNLVNNRLVLAKDENENRLYPKFTQKVIPTCSDYIWQEDSSFFIHNHVFAMPKGIESLEDLQDYLSDLAARPMLFERPLWEVQVLTDFGEVRDTVILFRMHPCVADGVSMVKILYKSIADVDSVTTVPPALSKSSCVDSLRSVIDAPISFASRFLQPKSDFNLLHGQHIHLSGKKVVTWSEPFSLAYATKIKQVSKSTLNEVFMSVAAGSIRNYLILNGIPHPFDMQSSIPVYYGTNKHTSGIGNDVLLMRVNLPTNTEGAVPRLWTMKERMSQVRQSSLFAITRRLFKFSHLMLAESLWNKLWIYILRKCTCIISSLPGPEINLRVSSKQIKTIFYWFPPVQHVALAISFFTYGDTIQMAVSSDRNVLPNPEIIAKDFIFQMQLLYEQLGHRRIPGEHLSSKKMDWTLLNTEIKPEESVAQLQKKMMMIHQELQNLKHKMDSRKYEQLDEDHKLLKRIEHLKEQFRELLVEMRKRKAAESELAMTFSEEDSTEDDDDFDIPRRPFRRRAMSVSSRISTSSVSSTVRPLPAPTPSITPDYSPDSPLISNKQVPYTSYAADRKFNTVPYASRRPSSNKQTMEELEILDYQYSPSLERRQYKQIKK